MTSNFRGRVNRRGNLRGIPARRSTAKVATLYHRALQPMAAALE
jgi:hypothetical protein